jgi:hypothetical protein
MTIDYDELVADILDTHETAPQRIFKSGILLKVATEIKTLRAEVAELRAGILWSTGLGEAEETTTLRAELAATKERLGEAVDLIERGQILVKASHQNWHSTAKTFLAKELSQ